MNLHRRTVIFLTAVILLLAASMPLLADMGPKPSITVVVENPPKADYYLDLLISDFEGEPYSNIYDERELDGALLELLRNDPVEGWHAAFTVGTQVPLFGKLTGDPAADGRMSHTFSYFGTPHEYRIFIVTGEGETYLSDVIEKQIFQERITVRLGEGTIDEFGKREGTPYSDGAGGTEVTPTDIGGIDLVDRPSVALLYLGQFASTFVPTLILEFLVLMLFRIPVKRNFLVFLGVNLLTQGLLTVCMTGRLISGGVFAAFFAFVPLELCILAMECVLYLIFMRDTGKMRRALYAVAANIVSAAVGCVLLLLR